MFLVTEELFYYIHFKITYGLYESINFCFCQFA